MYSLIAFRYKGSNGGKKRTPYSLRTGDWRGPARRVLGGVKREGWVYPPIRVEPPRAPNRWCRGSSRAFWRPPDPSRPSLFRCHFFNSFFYRFLIDFASQNPPQINPKSIKLRCQNPLRFRHCFSNDFWSMSIRKVKARPPKIIENPFVFQWKSKNRLFELLLRSVSVLVPTCFDFGTKIGPKSLNKSIKNDIRFVIDSLIIFWTILAPFWSHLGSLRC